MAGFRGFAARTDNGTPCYVINANATQYKVTLGTVHGYAGDHTVRPVISYTGKGGWIAKSKVVR